MALWLCRAGKFGEYETKFIEDEKIYCTWNDLNWDMSQPQNVYVGGVRHPGAAKLDICDGQIGHLLALILNTCVGMVGH